MSDDGSEQWLVGWRHIPAVPEAISSWQRNVVVGLYDRTQEKLVWEGSSNAPEGFVFLTDYPTGIPSEVAIGDVKISGFHDHFLVFWDEDGEWYYQEITQNGEKIGGKIGFSHLFRLDNSFADFFQFSNGDVGLVGAWNLESPSLMTNPDVEYDDYIPLSSVRLVRLSDPTYEEDCLGEWSQEECQANSCLQKLVFTITREATGGGRECDYEDGVIQYSPCFGGSCLNLASFDNNVLVSASAYEAEEENPAPNVIDGQKDTSVHTNRFNFFFFFLSKKKLKRRRRIIIDQDHNQS
eukprot:Lithocolla_globosa_v1_NODE_2978_length_1805_cov_12.398286.p1 type:complete len:295 gc:universal NODE_2978_length_1805_cov_12.398286:923-39(-)